MVDLIDTNILVYAYDVSEREKHEISKNILSECWKKKVVYGLSTQNLSELFVNVTKKIQKPVSAEEVLEDINDFISFPNFVIFAVAPHILPRAIEISMEFKISYWDALIAAVMRENNVYTIITENEKDFKKIPWIKVVNPFREV